MILFARDEELDEYWRLDLKRGEFPDNGHLLSIGLSVGKYSYTGHDLTRDDIADLRKKGKAIPVTKEQWNHSGCLSSCRLRGDLRCRW